MDQREIENKINAEFNDFYQAKYPNKLPGNLMSLFNKAVMFIIIGKFQLHTKKIKEIMAKKPGDLTTLEVGLVTNVIMDVPFDKLYDNLDKALISHERLENVVIDFNFLKRAKEVELAKKKQTYMELAGTGPSKILAKA